MWFQSLWFPFAIFFCFSIFYNSSITKERQSYERHKRNDEDADEFPFDIKEGQIEPVYQEFTGWKTKMSKMKSEDEFPEEFNAYLDYLEDYLGVPIKIVSVGPDREQTILRYVK